jgi:fibronectin-binding autotransporter adhesin
LGQATSDATNLVLGGGTLRYTGATASTNRAFTLTADTTSTIEVTDNNLTISGASATTSGSLTKTGAGTLTLSGANGHTGLTRVSAGTLAYGANNALASGAVTVSGGILDIATFSGTVGAVTLSSGSITGTTGVLTGTSYAVESGTISAILGGASVGLTKTTGDTVTLSGTNTYTGGTTINEGVLSVANIGNGGVAGNLGAASSAAANLILGGGTLQYTGDTASTNRDFTLSTGTTSTIEVQGNNLTLSGASAETDGALTKTGAGTLTLTGTNSHTGLTTVSAGTLVVGKDGTGSLNSSVSVAASGRLEGSGTITGNVTVAGTHAPGNSPGIQTVEGNLNYASGSVFEWDLTKNTVAEGGAGVFYDQVIGSGGVLSGEGAVFKIIIGGDASFSDTDFWGVFGTTRSWKVFDNFAGNISAIFSSFEIVSVDRNYTHAAGVSNPPGSFSMSSTGTLTWNAVPEPGNALVGLLICGALLRRRRVS